MGVFAFGSVHSYIFLKICGEWCKCVILIDMSRSSMSLTLEINVAMVSDHPPRTCLKRF